MLSSINVMNHKLLSKNFWDNELDTLFEETKSNSPAGNNMYDSDAQSQFEEMFKQANYIR